MNRSHLLLLSCVFVLSCGDDTDNTDEPCTGAAGMKDPECQLLLPTAAPTAGSAKADYSCLAKVTPPAQPTKALIIKGKTKERLSTGADQQKGSVTVEVWTDQTDLTAKPVGTTTSDSDGNFQVEIPLDAWKTASAKGPRVAWRISTKTSETLSTVEFNDLLYKDVSELKTDSTSGKLVLEKVERITVSHTTLQAIEALLGTTHDKKKGIVLGVVRDCNRKEVQNASAGVVDSAGKPVSGPELYYFKGKFPTTRTSQAFTSEDGYFTLMNVAPGKGTDIRVIGNVGGKQTVLSRQIIPVSANTLVIADFDPLPEPLK